MDPADSDDDDDDHDSDDDDDKMSLASSTVSVADENTLGILIRSYVRKLQHEQHLSAHAEVPLYFQLPGEVPSSGAVFTGFTGDAARVAGGSAPHSSGAVPRAPWRALQRGIDLEAH